jgi:type II secretory pathway predicted ATPase ExeA
VYETHFGLRPRPFADSAGPSHYVSLASREAVRRRLRYALDHGGGPALLFGPAGTGKTLLAQVLARDLGGRSAHLTFPALPAADLLEYLADELRCPLAEAPGLAGTLRRIRAGLAAGTAGGSRRILVVDEAHLVEDVATFEALRLLLNFASEGPPDLALLLVGGPELLLRIPASLADRVQARCLLGPLTLEESTAYLEARVEAAGSEVPLFEPDAAAELHQLAEGLPRRLNRLADLALLVAYADGADRVELASVRTAAREGTPAELVW